MAKPVIIGLTGSIGMGKSETARMFRAFGVPVFDADAAVHALQAKGGLAVGPVEDAFPGTVVSGAVNRQLLGKRVLGDPAAMRQLEQIIHPLVHAEEKKFLARAMARRKPVVVLDIPLLLETGGESRVDHVVVVSAPPVVQRGRVLQRPGMEEGKFRSILEKQMPDKLKRRKADFIVETGLGKRFARKQVQAIIKSVQRSSGVKR